MQNEKITIEFNAEKYRALRIFSSKKGIDVNSELVDLLERLYQKNVPSGVKEFIEAE